IFCQMPYRLFCLLMAAVGIQAQQTPSINDLHAECLGNVIRLSVAPLFEEVATVFNDTHIINLTPGLATQCGFSFKFDPMGNAMFFASLQNCFSQNMDDKMFSLVMQFRLPGNHMTEDPVYRVGKTCSYTPWTSREILCDRNYMEVSVRRTLPDIQTVPEQPTGGPKARSAVASGYKMTAVVFSPSKKVMNVDEVQRKGYAIANTPTRLVLRSPHNAEETYLQNVAGVPMRVLSTSTFFEQKWLVTRVDATAVCPTPEAVVFTPEVITWYMPKHIDPLFSSDAFTMLEVYMGIDAKRLDTEEMAARNYSVLVTEAHIIVEIPVGAVGGYFKSHIQDDQYFVTYTIEPMLELLWIEEVAHEDTSYKVLFPITTPPMARPPQVRNYTVPEQAVFVLELGTFNLDVELLNITFPTMVLTVAECNARGFNVQEQRSPDNTLKTFRMEVPFSDPVVRRAEQGVTTFTLQLIYGLVVFPEYAPFSHSAVVDAVLLDIVPPSVTGNCDQENFHITVDYRNQDPFFVVLVGKRLLNHELAQQYLTEGDADFTITLPFSSPDAVFESVHSSSVRSRLDVALLNPYNNMTIKYFSLACSFLKTLTECFSNGTMTALAVKVESAPGLNPGQLTLSDPACGPTYSDDRFAYFHFTVNSCGTTRKFINNVMLYENEISLPDELEVKLNATVSSEEEYQLKVSCYYVANTTRTLAFLTRPRDHEPFVETGTGRLMVRMRLAQDASYNTFHQEEDYPVVRYLRQPLHFEVELTTSSDPKVALVLDHCWATLNEDRDSRPRWNLIINGCENPGDPYRVVFHPVVADARVHFPPHVKRFEVYMFSFTEDAGEPSGQVFVHCDVVICDASSPSGGPCSGQCVNQDNPKRGWSCFMLFRPWQTITELIASLSLSLNRTTTCQRPL
uniref:ZP domain-containing protein n=1 Tax=Oncorhynchus mykiss TaxID=8022 RepID=A0A8C7QVA3_ONCMY